MNQDEKFNNLLNVCLDRVMKGEAISQCLQDYPEQAKELEPLLKAAVAFKMASATQPAEDFKARARYEFQAAVRELNSAKKQRSPFLSWRWQWQSAWTIAIMAIVIIFGGTGGTVVAARNSMPDNPLYSFKIFTENVQLTFTRSDNSKAELNAQFADNRAQEMLYAASRGNTDDARVVAKNLSSNMSNIAYLTGNELAAENQERSTVASSQNQQAPAPAAAPQASIPSVLSMAAPTTGPASAPGSGPSVTPEPTSPPSVVVMAPPPPVKAAVPATVQAPQADTSAQPETAGAGPQNSSEVLKHQYGLDGAKGEASEQANLRQTIAEKYAALQASLEEALNLASPDVRPIIRQAIAQAQTEYEKSIQNLDQAALNTR